MKYVQINTVPNGSTGAVMFREQEKRLASGDECWAMWGRGRAAENEHEFNFGSKVGFYLDVACTRLDDRAGFHSKATTHRLLSKLDEIDPDIVHLHNLHGYYINIEMLFHWLEARAQSTCWTLHDCWSFTGHCSYFTYVKCEQWRTHCSYEFKCPQKREYPKSCLMSAAQRNFEDKQRLFTLLPADKMTIITPSQWLADLVKQSFLSKYSVEVRHNEIDRTVFKPSPSDFRERYGIGDRFMILGVASPWTKRKGIDDFIRLANDLDDSCVVVMVGLNNEQIRHLSSDVIALGRTESQLELAKYYSTADVFFNPTREDNYPTVNLEAEACGLPVVSYDTGGSRETLLLKQSCVVGSYSEALELLLRRSRLKLDADAYNPLGV